MIAELHENNRYMRAALTSRGFNLGESQSPIIPIFIEDHRKLQRVVRELYQEGIYSTPICFPAVKVHEGRIRLILNAAHTREHIDTTVEALERICRQHQVIGEREDELTGLYNRAQLDAQLEKSFRLAIRREKPVSFAMVEVDGFSQIVERFGADVGNRVLQTIAAIFTSSMRSGDMASRYDGAVFGLLFINAAASDLLVLCDRLLQKVSDTAWDEIAAGLQVSISIGLTDSTRGNNVDVVRDNAHAALEQARRTGGNCRLG